MSVEFYRESPGEFDSRTLDRKTLNRWTGRTRTTFVLARYIKFAEPSFGGGAAAPRRSKPCDATVSFHNFKSQNFKLSISNPKSKYVAYLSVLSQISNCQGLGRRNKHEILKTDRTANLRTKILDFRGFDSSRISILRGGIPWRIGNFPESLSQQLLAGIILVGRLGAACRSPRPSILWQRVPPWIYIYIYIYTLSHVYTHIYIYRERERDR